MKDLLKKYFGYDDFRPLQEEIINHVIAGNDCFVLMPTGGGKSLCYQLPAVYFSGLTIVISPLIALMKDQVDGLRACGIATEFINSSLTAQEVSQVCTKLRNNSVKLLYIAPERFALKDFQIFLSTLAVSLIAIDEAHCISEWGHNFRPEYRNLNVLQTLFPQAPIIALTATATPKVRDDIVSHLHLEKAQVFISSFDRENLHVRVIEKKQALPKLVHLLEKYKNESVIIYCFSRNETESLAEHLLTHGFSVRAYHAGLDAQARSTVQDLFIKDEIKIVVATIAFGMGIDKPDVRLVVHFTYPKTLEGYYQEIGRAGRDGLPSDCVMFYTYADTRKHEFFINQISDPVLKQRAQEKLEQVSRYARLTTCRKQYLLRYFGEVSKTHVCSSCDVCVKVIEDFAVTKTPTQKGPGKVHMYNQVLFERLRALRKILAAEANVPAFVIFGDVSLREMAAFLPQDAQAFSKITGVGAKKLEQFGKQFLAVIALFVQENTIAPVTLPAKKSAATSVNKPSLGYYARTKDFLASKMTLDVMAKNLDVAPATVISHIEKLLLAGEDLDIDYLKPPSQQFTVIADAFQHLGLQRLKPVFDQLKIYTYLEISLVRMFLLRDKKLY